MKRSCWLALILCAALVRADWQTFLQEEPARQKRDDTPFVTLDRLLKAEREASPEDVPYLFLYTTLKLNEMRWSFRGHGQTGVLPNLSQPSQGWTQGQAAALLKVRKEQLLQDVAQYAKVTAEPFASAVGRWTTRAAWPNMSALALTWQTLWQNDKDVSAKVCSAARVADDGMLEGRLRLGEIADLPQGRSEALAAMERERTWQRDVLASLRLAQAGILQDKGKEEALPEVVRLLTEARDLTTLHAIYREAQERLNRIRQAELTAEALPQVVWPGAPFRVTVRHRNVRGATVTFSGMGQERVVPLKLSKTAPYAWGESEVELPALPPGKHEAIFRCANTFAQMREAKVSHIFHACTFTVAKVGRQTCPSATAADAWDAFAYAYVVADVRTGKPLPDATVTLLRRMPEKDLREQVYRVTTDTLGLARVPRAAMGKPFLGNPRDEVVLRVEARGETLEMPLEYFEVAPQTEWQGGVSYDLRVFTDRILYRPGETVCAQVVLCKRERTEAYVPVAKAEGTLIVYGHGANGMRKLFEKQVALSDYGSLAENIALPKDFVGNLTFRLKTGGTDVRAFGGQVVEFKAPNFTVKLQRERLGTPLTDPVRYKGSALDLSGAPLAGAAVSWEVQGEGETVRGVATVAADGSFAFSARLPEADRDQSVIATARVLNANGERQEGRCRDFLTRWGYRFEGKIPEWIVAGDPFDVALESERAVGGTLAVLWEGTNVVTRVAFDKPGPVRLTLPAGDYGLRAESGPVTNHVGRVVVLPRDGCMGERFDKGSGALLRVRQKPPFAIGERIDLFAGIQGKGPAFLMVSTRQGVERVLPLTSPFLSFTVEESLREGFALTVYGFDQGCFRSETETFRIKPLETLKVEAVRVAEVARPGSEQTWEIAVDDPAAELVVTCYDKAVDALRKNDWQPIAPPWRYWNTWELTRALLNPVGLWLSEPLPGDGQIGKNVMLDCTMGVAEEASLEGGGGTMMRKAAYAGASPGVEPIVPEPRTNFARTALWAPQKRLKDGKAVFVFTLPDSLTTWKLMAFAHTPDGRSGTLTRDCLARLDVMLKPYLPRTLRVGDRLTLQVLLTNATDRPISTWVTFNRSDRRPVTLPAKGSVTVSWEVVAQSVPGMQVFEFTTEGDAVRLEVPVQDDRVRVEDVYPLTLVDTKPTTVTVAEPVPLLDLTQRWEHAPAAAVAESLRAFFVCPEAGNDDAFARFAALLLLQQMGVAPEGADIRAEALLNRLLAQRTPEGLWPWFPKGRGDGWVTAEICLGVARLRNVGLVPKPLVDAVRDTLARQAETLPFAVWAYAVATLSPEIAQADATLTDRLFRAYREAGSVQERRMLALAAQRLGVKTVADQGLKDTLDAINASEIWGVWWPQERTWWRRWHTPIESHALGLEQLRVAGHDAEATAAARWLLQHRRLNGWGTTRATLAAAFALCGEPSGWEAKPDQPPRLRIFSQPLAEGKGRKVTFTREAPGLSFGSLVATYRLPLAQVPPPLIGDSAGLTLTRTLEPAEPKVGDDVTVTLTLTAAQPMHHVRLRDERPANTEPVEVLPWWDGASGSYIVPGDTGIDVYLTELPRGVTAIRYRLKATHAGQCRPGLATAAPTVAPDFAARTDSRPLIVR